MKFSLILLFLLSSCGSIPDNVQQCINEVRDRPYIKNVYDCSNMSYRLCKLLEKKGYKVAIVVHDNHAIVRLDLGSYHYIDSTKTKFQYVKKPDGIVEVWTLRQIHFIKSKEYRDNITTDYK